MYIQVRLLHGFLKPLWYKVPSGWPQTNLVGAAIAAPVKNRSYPAIVERYSTQKPEGSFTIKEATELKIMPQDKHYSSFIVQLADYHHIPAITLQKRIRSLVLQKKVITKNALVAPEVLHATSIKPTTTLPTLTDEQQRVVDFLDQAIIKSTYTPTVLHGVTGSGKTEIYKKLIITTHTQKKSTVLLLPEVSLAAQFATILKQQLPADIALFSFHSAAGTREKRDLWQALIEGMPVVIIGVHLPILLPIADLGLIIVDEEHEVGYQEKKHPKINSKEAALMRAKRYNIPIVLGSATPSIATLYNIKTKGWHFFQIKKRFAGSFPQIKLVSLADHKQRTQFWISKELETALKERLHKKEQSIIFLNRRGYSFFVQCKLCSFIFQCNSCSVSLTLHSTNDLMCHYCGASKPMPERCSSCNATKSNLLKKGIGTQQLVSILQKILPAARIERADLDATINQKRWQKTVQEFQKQQIDILVGTQTITKGYHFPHVTLVGIVWADLNLHIPFYNAAEQTLQQLIQVAGRAGRQRPESLVIAQIMLDHKIFDYLTETNYVRFYEQELAIRTTVGYPPVMRLAELELRHKDEAVLARDAQSLARLLKNVVQQKNLRIQILGPALPPVHKIKNMHMRKMYLKAPQFGQLSNLVRCIDHTKFESAVLFTPNPLM